ncbi:MAG: beta-N-acetylhexosaminidase [Pseudohongiellaceae bacterium]
MTTNNTLGPLMLDLEGLTLSVKEAEALRRPVVGGLILFSRNYHDQNQLLELTESIRAVRGELLICVDQEGGRVQRLREGFLSLPPLNDIGKLYGADHDLGLEMAYTCGWAMAAEVVHHGIDFSFAPVLDLFNCASEVIKERAFAADFETVSILAKEYVKGMNSAGMAATGKHFPGHGTVIADSHFELPVDTRSAEAILQGDYQAFARCIEFLGAIMPAHVKYPSLDDDCAGYSSYWIKQKLRQELGFDGVVFSDDLTMAAAHSAGDVCTRADLALDAGCDMVLVCNDSAAALKVADHLESKKDNSWQVSSERLSSMRAKQKLLGDVYSSDEWRDAEAKITEFQKGARG